MTSIRTKVACWVLLVLVGVVGAGCGSHAAGVSAAQAISGFDPARGSITASFARLNEVVRTRPAETRAVALSQLRSKPPAERFAAVYAFALTATPADTVAVRSLLGSTSETDRLLAAATLARLRDTRGIPTLIAALRTRARLAYWGPPLPAWRFARLVLLERTGKDFGLRRATTPPSAAKVAATWTRWWARSRATFRFPTSESIP